MSSEHTSPIWVPTRKAFLASEEHIKNCEACRNRKDYHARCPKGREIHDAFLAEVIKSRNEQEKIDKRRLTKEEKNGQG